MPNSKSPNGGGWLANRERLVQALQGACFGSRQTLPPLRAALDAFVREATHQGRDREWILRAVRSAVDSGLMPSLEESRRHALSVMVSRLAEEACRPIGSEVTDSRG
jgi:hypothetical protein